MRGGYTLPRARQVHRPTSPDPWASSAGCTHTGTCSRNSTFTDTCGWHSSEPRSFAWARVRGTQRTTASTTTSSSPTLAAGRRWGGGSAPLGPPSVSAPLTARQTAFPELGAAGQTPAHRLPVGRQTANIIVVDLQRNLVRQFGRVGEGPGEFSGVRNVWALTVCSGQSVAVHDAWRRVFVLFGSDGESSGDPAGWPRIRLDSGAAL